MSRILRPAVKTLGGRAAAATDERWSTRLTKYIPLSISGAYPILDNALSAYAKQPLAGLGITPWYLGFFVFVALLVFSIIDLHVQYNKQKLKGWPRWRVQLIQTAMAIMAFLLWTYSIKGSIWEGTYNAALAVILTVLFLLATAYVPSVTPDESSDSGFANLKD